MAEVRWFFSESGEVRGPYLESDLIRLARSGRISDSEYILREGHQEWLSAGPLVQNAHSLPIDGEARLPVPATTPRPAVIVEADEAPPAPRPLLWAAVMLAAVALGGFAFYMLGPWSPILHQPNSATSGTDASGQPTAAPGSGASPAAPAPADAPSPVPQDPAADAANPDPAPPPAEDVPIEEAPIGPEPEPSPADPAPTDAPPS